MLTDEELCDDLRSRWEAEMLDVVPPPGLLATVRSRHAGAQTRRSIVAAGAVVSGHEVVADHE